MVAPANKLEISLPSDTEILMTRSFKAPAALVFAAYTKPEHIRHWWHAGFGEMTECNVDLRVGGRWRYAMNTPDGQPVGFSGEFLEIAPPDRLVFTEAFDPFPDSPATVTITFTEQSGFTRVQTRVQHLNKADRDAHLQSGMEVGVARAYDLMQQRLNEMAAEAIIEGRDIVITRLFDAPRELVFDAFTNPVHLAQWWGPRGFTIASHRMDFRAGGSWQFTMHGPDGTDYPNFMRYTEVARPERLVYAHGTGPDAPPLFHGRITFTEENGRTRVTMRTTFESEEVLREIVEKVGAIDGGKQTLARLAEFLEQSRARVQGE